MSRQSVSSWGSSMQLCRFALVFAAALLLPSFAGCGKVNLHCAPGLLSCGGTGCVDPASDGNNCGTCGHSCGDNGLCSGGTCSCSGGTTSCSDGCVDLTADAANCGACGKACGTGEVCSGSACVCQTGFARCGTTCTDLTSDTANCAGCGHACTNGQTCQASACACPGATALCGSICCTTGNVCNGGACMPPPAPMIATKWNDPTGSLDGTNIAVHMTFTPTGIPGTVYQCRTGTAASFTPTVPAWGPCDGGSGVNPTYQPALPTGFDQGGSMRTEFRYQLPDPYTSPVVSYDFYLHNSLNDVGSCPDAVNGQPEPHQSDAAYFGFAKTYDPTNFPTTTVFPAGAQLRNPFITIPFKSVTTTVGARATGFLVDGNNVHFPATGALPLTFDFTLKTLSLRHKFVMSADQTMILMRRQYGFSTGAGGTDCRNLIWVGTKQKTGPDDLRGRRKIDCEALVVNANGKAICLSGVTITPQPFDQQIPGAGTTGPMSVSNAANSALLTGPAGTFNGVIAGDFVRVTADGVWRHINSVNTVSTPQNVQLYDAIPLAHTNVAWTFYHGATNKNFVTPSGYTHLRTTRAVTNPSGRNKCTTAPTCNFVDNASDHNWYLPP
ncbi:MAG: Tryptophan synthase alpha chain [bacterium]|nr:Tryptophan synthase alpha chain [bacterium]